MKRRDAFQWTNLLSHKCFRLCVKQGQLLKTLQSYFVQHSWGFDSARHYIPPYIQHKIQRPLNSPEKGLNISGLGLWPSGIKNKKAEPAHHRMLLSSLEAWSSLKSLLSLLNVPIKTNVFIYYQTFSVLAHSNSEV